ncbi:MAG TPA: sterol desaturase family protein [Polyangiaceae bacterium]|nr:sterol desaturase family protein [Polyangiaceae bacterium]
MVATVALALLLLERASPRRPRRRPARARLLRNAAVALSGGLVIAAVEGPVVKRLTSLVARRRWGLLPRLGLPAWAETAAAVVALDYTLYLWHLANHRVASLWRFHAVHHVDEELDLATAARFHGGELLLSVAVRAAQILAIGVSPRALSWWQTLTLASVSFHHANVRLPPRLERALGRVIVTPHLHTIHHSTRRAERDANWSSGLVLWDRAHGTLRFDADEGAIAIGVEAAPERGPLALLVMPFL